MSEETKPKKIYETGHAKLLESWTRLRAFGATLDQVKLNPPADLNRNHLIAISAQAADLHGAVGNSKAEFRTAALDRSKVVDKFEAIASRAVAQLEARGASKETVKDARSYVRKIQGKRAKKIAAQDPSSPGFDPTEKNISASQQSNAAKISNFDELAGFLEVQPEYAGVTQTDLVTGALRDLADEAQTKHNMSVTTAAALASDRNERNKFYYLDPNNLCDLAARYKSLVKGAYGAGSVEYKTINAISFKKPKL